jgi:hypothetical protein
MAAVFMKPSMSKEVPMIQWIMQRCVLLITAFLATSKKFTNTRGEFSLKIGYNLST